MQEKKKKDIALFRKWRSQNFADLVGQETVVKTLKNVLLSESPARAYLFCGPRGTGKTSLARIFAKAINCSDPEDFEPCNHCPSCVGITGDRSLDVFELDAASNTQVDKIREFIVEKVHFAPVQSKFKVYIIDEVHKLSNSSFNALLKTLEEPPPHVVFILATTHPHELPITILSRCQRYDFRTLTIQEISGRLEMVAAVEDFEIEESAIRVLAKAANGALRDALVLLEQAYYYGGGVIKTQEVEEMLGFAGQNFFPRLIDSLQQKNTLSAFHLLDEQIQRGCDLRRVAEDLLDYLRTLMLANLGGIDTDNTHLTPQEIAVFERQGKKLGLRTILTWIGEGMKLHQQIRQGEQQRLLWEMMLASISQLEPHEIEYAQQLQALQKRIVDLEKAAQEQRFDKVLSLPALAAMPSMPQAPAGSSGAGGEGRQTQPSKPSKPQAEPSSSLTTPPTPKPSPPTTKGRYKGEQFDSEKAWIEIMGALAKEDGPFGAVLKEVRLLEFDEKKLKLEIPEGYSWHQTKIEQENAKIIKQVEHWCDRKVAVEIVMGKPQEKREGGALKGAGSSDSRIFAMAKEIFADGIENE